MQLSPVPSASRSTGRSHLRGDRNRDMRRLLLRNTEIAIEIRGDRRLTWAAFSRASFSSNAAFFRHNPKCQHCFRKWHRCQHRRKRTLAASCSSMSGASAGSKSSMKPGSDRALSSQHSTRSGERVGAKGEMLARRETFTSCLYLLLMSGCRRELVCCGFRNTGRTGIDRGDRRARE